MSSLKQDSLCRIFVLAVIVFLAVVLLSVGPAYILQ